MIGSVTEWQQQMAAIGKARGGYQERGATEGPGTCAEPVTPPEPDAFSRPYDEAGHAAPSPQHEPPRQSPMPPGGRGILTPIEMPWDPAVAGNPGPLTQAMAAHQARISQSAPIPSGEAR